MFHCACGVPYSVLALENEKVKLVPDCSNRSKCTTFPKGDGMLSYMQWQKLQPLQVLAQIAGYTHPPGYQHTVLDAADAFTVDGLRAELVFLRREDYVFYTQHALQQLPAAEDVIPEYGCVLCVRFTRDNAAAALRPVHLELAALMTSTAGLRAQAAATLANTPQWAALRQVFFIYASRLYFMNRLTASSAHDYTSERLETLDNLAVRAVAGSKRFEITAFRYGHTREAGTVLNCVANIRQILALEDDVVGITMELLGTVVEGGYSCTPDAVVTLTYRRLGAFDGKTVSFYTRRVLIEAKNLVTRVVMPSIPVDENGLHVVSAFPKTFVRMDAPVVDSSLWNGTEIETLSPFQLANSLKVNANGVALAIKDVAYYTQVQFCMHFLNIDECVVAVDVGPYASVYTVIARDKDFSRIMLEKLETYRTNRYLPLLVNAVQNNTLPGSAKPARKRKADDATQ